MERKAASAVSGVTRISAEIAGNAAEVVEQAKRIEAYCLVREAIELLQTVRDDGGWGHSDLVRAIRLLEEGTADRRAEESDGRSLIRFHSSIARLLTTVEGYLMSEGDEE